MKNMVIVILFAISTALYPQEIHFSFGTGDTQIEAHLNQVNDYASADIALFRKDLALKFSASNADLDIYLVRERMRPADVYYGYVVSYTTARPLPEVMKIYKEKNGWGAVAKELGIKPGSDRFHKLKNSALGSIDKEKMKSRKGKTKQSSAGNKKGKKNK